MVFHRFLHSKQRFGGFIGISYFHSQLSVGLFSVYHQKQPKTTGEKDGEGSPQVLSGSENGRFHRENCDFLDVGMANGFG